MMRIPGRKFLRRALRPLRKRLWPGAVVLGYHRIADIEWDPLGQAVNGRNFAGQLARLAQFREVVSLGELARRQKAGRPVSRLAAVTFDDGYSDFYTNAVPALVSNSVPGTVFVATGFTGHQFWWEEVAAQLMPSGDSRPPLTIQFGDQQDSVPYPGVQHPDTARAAALDICYRLRTGDKPLVESVLSQLRRWSGCDSMAAGQGAPLSRQELMELARHPQVEIGAHTVDHGCLGDMSPSEQAREIQASRSDLEQMTGQPVVSFSYPNGSFGRSTPRIVEDSGFECACTSMDGLFHRRGNRYLIPRLWVPNCGPDQFQQWLSAWVDI